MTGIIEHLMKTFHGSEERTMTYMVINTMTFSNHHLIQFMNHCMDVNEWMTL